MDLVWLAPGGAKKDLLTENDYGITRNIIDKIKEQYYDPVH